MKRKQKIIGATIILVIFISILSVKFVTSKISQSSMGSLKEEDIFIEKLEEPKENKGENKQNKQSRITVEIKGQVNKPGVYTLTKDSILKDLIYESGGITGEGSVDDINQAEKLRDNSAYRIPNKNEEKNNTGNIKSTLASSNGNSGGSGDQVSLNNSTKEELGKLPGVGPATADKIIAWRESNGSFNSIEDLKKVSGIGETKFNNLKDKIIP